MFHLSAFAQSVDPGNALTAINAVREEQFFTSGVDLRVPVGLANIIGALCTINDASLSRAQIQSPSLRVRTNLDVEPIVNGIVLGSPPEQSLWPETPIPVTSDEALNFAVLSDPAAVATHQGLVWLADGPQSPVVGEIFTVRATSAVTLVFATWVNGNLTLAQTLPAGRYAVVGMRARGTNLLAARLLFSEQAARPGVAAVNAIGDLDTYWNRFGRMGVFGEFSHTIIPTVDCLGQTDTAQIFLLDMIRLG